MFEYMAKYIGESNMPNRFRPVSDRDIVDSERRLGFLFPSELRSFFKEIGRGFLKIGVEDNERDPSLINRVLGPVEIADLLCDENNELRPDEGFVEGVMPFFDVGESTYLVLRPSDQDNNRVYWPDGKRLISKSIGDFFHDLYKHASFYIDE